MKKDLSLFVLCIILCIATNAQFYYKDLMFVGEMRQKAALFKSQKVKSVKYLSFDNNKQPIEGFEGTQQVNSNFTKIVTQTKNTLSGQSDNTASFDSRGLLINIIDTTDGNKAVTDYSYDQAGRLIKIISVSTSPGNFSIREEHIWSYGQKDQPASMLKIKNARDTTFVTFSLDEKGRVAEEKAVFKGSAQPTIYYYYDDSGVLSDIVRYNNRAKRLLPDYVFEYENNRLATMLVVEEGSSEYQKWYYSYDEDGLKAQDACYAKNKELIARIEYEYVYY